MNDPVTEIFGYILVAVGILLAVREHYEFARRHVTGSHFVTGRRYRRRLVVSFVMGLIGSLFVLQARALIPLKVHAYMIFVFVLMGLALLLMLLVIVDVMDTARTAAKQSMVDLHRAVEEQKKRQQVNSSEERGDT